MSLDCPSQHPVRKGESCSHHSDLHSCGIGFAPARQGESDREFLLSLVEAVEDIPGAALNVGIDWSWETFPEYEYAPARSAARMPDHIALIFLRYLDKLDTLSLAIDVAVLIGHAPVRAYVLGERASISDRPGGPANDIITEEEIEQSALCNVMLNEAA